MKSNIRWLVLAVISSALFLIVIDMTVLYTALPRLTHDLRASSTEKLWIMNAYSLTIAGLLPGTGALSDRFGAKKLFTSGLVVFCIASLIAAFAPNSGTLISARVVLAIGAAMMMPATLAIVRQAFEDPNERALAIGIWSAVASGGAALGPVIGGILLECKKATRLTIIRTRQIIRFFQSNSLALKSISILNDFLLLTIFSGHVFNPLICVKHSIHVQ
ncbi:multidrug efflux protein QacB [Xenorhabdus indica]|nr:multidrug efflux protein QacB [Xenorhabdus indica]